MDPVQTVTAVEKLSPLSIGILVCGVITAISILVFAILRILAVLAKTKTALTIGELKIGDKPIGPIIGEMVRLHFRKRDLLDEWIKECRSIARSSIAHIVGAMRLHAKPVIYAKYSPTGTGCIDEPVELRDLRLIMEGVSPVLVALVMDSVERNHYAERTQLDWEATVRQLFSKVIVEFEKYLIDRFQSDVVPSSELSAVLHTHRSEYLDIFSAMMSEFRGRSIEIQKMVELLSEQIAALERGESI